MSAEPASPQWALMVAALRTHALIACVLNKAGAEFPLALAPTEKLNGIGCWYGHEFVGSVVSDRRHNLRPAFR